MRTFWADRPLSVKLSFLVASGALVVLLLTVIAVGPLAGEGEHSRTLRGATAATQAALEADMMHDAVRGDVLQALLVTSGPQYDSAVTDLAEHSATMREVLAGVTERGLGSGVDAAVRDVQLPVDEYLAAADEIVTLAGRDLPGAMSAYPTFLTAFSALEESLPSVGAAIADRADAAEAADTAQRGTARVVLTAIAAAGVLVMAALGWLVTRSVVGPLRRVAAVVAALAEGDLRVSPGVTSRDEVGRMAAGLEASTTRMRAVIAAIGDSSTTLSAATEQLSVSAQDMARLAGESSVQSDTVAEAAGQVSGNVQTVAAGSAQMGVSIREIAQNASEVSRVAAQAVTAADSTTATVAKLGESSLEIAGVVKVITSIAEQTNLLALNATIEAARAGEAGKGFAVVANEVKELAQETAKATQDITARVQAIQTDTEGAVRAIGEISSIIALINDSQGTIASAVEEQTATTEEMNRNVAEAATSSDRIADNIAAVAASADSTTRAMADAQAAIDEVARLASSLHSSVATFRY